MEDDDVIEDYDIPEDDDVEDIPKEEEEEEVEQKYDEETQKLVDGEAIFSLHVYRDWSFNIIVSQTSNMILHAQTAL